MKKKKPEARFVPNREYKFDRAMQQAAERARAFAPVPISMVSNVPEFPKVGSNK